MEDRGPEVRLSVAECQKLEVLEEVRAGKRIQRSAAKVLGITDRWVRTLLGRLAKEGARGLAHRNRGRPSPRRLCRSLREKLIKLYRGRYQDFNLTHFRQMLQKHEQIDSPSRETIRQILLGAGVWSRQRQALAHRLRRPRREHEGELLQMDASIHPWLGADLPSVALLGAIDDATGDVPSAQIHPAETTEAYFHVLQEILQKRGIPRAIYTDQDSVFKVNAKKEIEQARDQGKVAETQFGRALRELGIERINAHSPQAKGRIERLWGTFQDRLLNELLLHRIHTLPEANEYLRKMFLPEYNRQFRRQATLSERLYRPAPPRAQREAILCFKETRVLARDHTFSFGGKPYQVLACRRVAALTGRRIEVRRTLRGQLEAWYTTQRLEIRPAPLTPPLAFPKSVLSRATGDGHYGRRGRVWL